MCNLRPKRDRAVGQGPCRFSKKESSNLRKLPLAGWRGGIGQRLAKRGKKFAAVLNLAALLLLSNALVVLAWEPDKFEVFCGKQTGDEDVYRPENRFWYANRYGEDVDVAQEPRCLSESRAELVADYAALALDVYKSLGFEAPGPNRLGPVVLGRDGKPSVRLFINRENNGIANTVSPCFRSGRPPDPERLSIMNFTPRYVNDFPPPRALHIIAHEVFHVVQNGQAYQDYPDTQRCGEIPGWLHEGTADALGMHVTYRRFPNYRPELSVLGALSFYALRPYNRAFTWEGDTEKDDQGNTILANYRSSSFWQHLADHYYGGSYAYLSDFLAVPDLTFGGDDWLNWLDALLRNRDVGSGEPFYLLFPDFLANYAMWGRDRYPNIGEEEWLKRAFGGCEEITLSPDRPASGLNLDLEMVSGRCIRVRVEGVEAGDLAQVKFMAYDRSAEALDNLHMAHADLSDKVLGAPGLEGGCYKLEEQARGKPACLIKPYTGQREGSDGIWVKTWSSPRQEATEGAFENLYILAHTPVRPKDSQHSHKAPSQSVGLSIGLDHMKLITNATGPVRKATASVNMTSTERIPMKGSEAPGGGVPGGVPGFGADALSKLPFQINVLSVSDKLGAGLTIVELTANDLLSGAKLAPTHRLVLQPESAIHFGSTGRFPTRVTLSNEHAMGQLNDLPEAVSPGDAFAQAQKIAALVNSGMMAGGDNVGRAEIEVLAFNDDLLHLRASGNYCRMNDADRKTGACRNPQVFEGEVITPFGWVWDGAQQFVSTDTEGMKLYRQRIRGQIGGATGDGDPDVSPPAGSQQTSASTEQVIDPPKVEQAECTCSCLEYQHFRSLGPRMADPAQSAQASAELQAMMHCPTQCMPQWMTCLRP